MDYLSEKSLPALCDITDEDLPDILQNFYKRIYEK